MKKIVTVLTILCFIAVGSTFAQDSYSGIKAGVGFANFSGSAVEGDNASSLTTYSAGVFYNVDLSDRVGFQTEVNLLNKGTTGGIQFLEGQEPNTIQGYDEVKATYLQVPFLFKGYLSQNESFTPSIYGGPAVSVVLGNSFEPLSNVDNRYPDPEFNDTESSFILGVQAEIQQFIIDARYEIGLSNPVRAAYIDYVRTSGIYVTAGFKF